MEVKKKRYVIDAFFVEWESFPRKLPHSCFISSGFIIRIIKICTQSQFFPFIFQRLGKVDEQFRNKSSTHLITERG